MTAHVMVHLAPRPDDVDEMVDAYHRISTALAGTPGLLGNELLRDPSGTRFAVLSTWESLAAFRAWESGAHHRDATADLRPHQDHDAERVSATYEVVASYPRDTPAT